MSYSCYHTRAATLESGASAAAFRSSACCRHLLHSRCFFEATCWLKSSFAMGKKAAAEEERTYKGVYKVRRAHMLAHNSTAPRHCMLAYKRTTSWLHCSHADLQHYCAQVATPHRRMCCACTAMIDRERAVQHAGAWRCRVWDRDHEVYCGHFSSAAAAGRAYDRAAIRCASGRLWPAQNKTQAL